MKYYKEVDYNELEPWALNLSYIKLYDQLWFDKKEITQWREGFYIVNKT
jgi:hypothetical protein